MVRIIRRSNLLAITGVDDYAAVGIGCAFAPLNFPNSPMASKKSPTSSSPASGAPTEGVAPVAAKKAVKKAPKKAAKQAAQPSAADVAPRKSASRTKTAAPTPDAIARAAYLNYRRRVDLGLPGDSHTDWVEAEQSLRAKPTR